MNTYEISANAIEPTRYEADSEDAAILLYVQDAGYTDVAAAADACNQSVEAFLADVHVIEIKG